jgi:G3E family GTPase
VIQHATGGTQHQHVYDTIPNLFADGSQVRCADIVLVNKCDVASLGQVSDVEDEVSRLAPGVRTLRWVGR